MCCLSSVLGLVAGVQAGTVLWSGSFNSYASSADFDKWSWSNQVGEYQWYIHGSQPTSHYLSLDPAFKNPADSSETHGLKLTIDSTATWNSQMERSELIPQTTQNLGKGNLFYHFSIKSSATNVPNPTLEHQILFFESHFTELKYGVAPNPTALQWMVQQVPHWSAPLDPDTWFNFAYDIDFDAGTVGLWASTNGDPLTKVVPNVAASTSTNSEDFHVGVLRIVNDPNPEDWFISGVFIETGPITTAIGNGTVVTPPAKPPTSSPPASSPVSTAAPTSAKPPASTTAPAGPLQTQFGQCGGTGFTGPTTCAAPFTCKAISAPYYYQCL